MLKSVVVDQFHSRLNVSDHLDEYSTILPDRLAVGITGVIDVSCDTALSGSIDSILLVDLKQERVVTGHLGIVVAAGFLFGIDNFSRVFDDPPAFADTADGKNTPPLNAGVLDSNKRFAGSFS